VSEKPKVCKTAFIALGSNLENPINQILQGFEALNQIPHTVLTKASSLYQSAPIGKLDQPDFINAVAQIETQLSPQELLTALLGIEQQQGRVRTVSNAPRTLDLDILLFENLKYHTDCLTIPHPRMTERAFVLVPLLEIAPECAIPELGFAAAFLEYCTGQQLIKLSPNR